MDTWLVISWIFMAGWLPHQDIGMWQEFSYDKVMTEQHSNATKIEFDINACLWDHWDIYGGIENFQSFMGFAKSGVNFGPYSIKYTIGTEIYLLPKSSEKLNVSAYVKHECQHPVNTWAGSTGVNSIYNSSYTDIGIKVQGKVSF